MIEVPASSTRRMFALQRLSGAIRAKYSQRDIDAAATVLWGGSLSCGDGNCVFGHPGGMHTNGGCKCHRRDLLTHLLMLRYLAEQLDVEVYDEP